MTPLKPARDLIIDLLDRNDNTDNPVSHFAMGKNRVPVIVLTF
jgi:hypothetical protein